VKNIKFVMTDMNQCIWKKNSYSNK